MMNKKTNEEIKENRQKAVIAFQKTIKAGGRALNIALIGVSGCGKSSFCNSIITTFCEKGWREWAITGHHGKLDEQVTLHSMR